MPRSSTLLTRAGTRVSNILNQKMRSSHYWYMWKLPMFGETNVDTILAELEACHKAHPKNHIRLLGFDNFAQSAGAAMVVYRGVSV